MTGVESAGRGVRIALVGRPGAGKGTQARLLADRIGVPTVSTGELLREVMQFATPLGLALRRYVTLGALVPDRLMVEVLWERLRDLPGRRSGFILDGFPRTIGQALALDGLLGAERLGAVVELAVTPDVSRRRLLTRCRSDDSRPTIERRLQVYEETTAGMVEWFRRAGRLVSMDGEQPAGALHLQLWDAVEQLTTVDPSLVP